MRKPQNTFHFKPFFYLIRYKLCEMAGMKTSWVLTEEERKLKFAGKGKKRKDRMSSSGLSDCQGTMDQVAPGQMPMLGLCEGDMNDIQTYVLASGCYEVCDEQRKIRQEGS